MGLSNNLSREAGNFSCWAPQPPQVFSIRGLRLYFPMLEPWVARSALLPAFHPGLSLCECGTVGSASGQTACSLCPTLRQSQSHQDNVSPLFPGCLSPPLLPVWMNVYFVFPWCWTFGYWNVSLAVQFSVSSGCARRCSVSTYASILPRS